MVLFSCLSGARIASATGTSVAHLVVIPTKRPAKRCVRGGIIGLARKLVCPHQESLDTLRSLRWALRCAQGDGRPLWPPVRPEFLPLVPRRRREDDVARHLVFRRDDDLLALLPLHGQRDVPDLT